MAANKRLWQTDKTREKIRISMLVNRLQDHVEGKADMSSTQVKAASVLLSKVMPDLSAADITTHEPESTMQEKFHALVNQIGEKQARTIYPDLAIRYLGEPKATHEGPVTEQ